MKSNNRINSVKAFAPASIANVFVGFDILGFSLTTMGDYVTLRKIDSGVKIIKITGIDGIPMKVEDNTAGYAVQKMVDDLHLDCGFEIIIDKGIPLSSGLGGSAASAVAAVVAVNHFLENPLKLNELLYYALCGESIASGSMHGDNVTASLVGGLTGYLSQEQEEQYNYISLPIPDNLYAIVVHPEIQIKTIDARAVIKEDLPLKAMTQQNMALLQFIAGCYENNLSWLKKGSSDFLIEPQRAHLIPGFELIKSVALRAGSIGWTISGAGPTMFGFSSSKEEALKIIKELKSIENTLKYKITIWEEKLVQSGAEIVEVNE